MHLLLSDHCWKVSPSDQTIYNGKYGIFIRCDATNQAIRSSDSVRFQLKEHNTYS